MNKKIIIAIVAVVGYLIWKKSQPSTSIAAITLKPGDPGYKEAKAAQQTMVS